MKNGGKNKSVAFIVLFSVNAIGIYTGKPNSCWSTVTIVFFSYYQIVDQQLFGYPHSSKYLILCSTQEIN